MKILKDFLTKINPIYLTCGYFILIVLLVFFKIRPYDYNISSLIGIWDGFAKLNPALIEKGFIIYKDGGYDGQFFFFVGKSLFTNGFENLPILDSFHLRFNRIGLSLLAGSFARVLGFELYPIITLILLILIHIFSFFILRAMLNDKNKYLSYFHLFSPFAINSILLIVSDSLFVSFSVICIYILRTIGVDIFSSNQSTNPKRIKSREYIVVFIILSFTCFIRESGIVLLGAFFLLCLYNKNFKVSTLLFLSICFYFTLTQLFKQIPNINPGTNPLGFLDLIDYPFFGFFKSIQIQSFSDIKTMFREFAKFPVFLFYILLAINLRNIKSYREAILFLPIIFILFTAGIGEVGYWLSFDNISRMFSLSTPFIILFKNQKETYNDYYVLPLSIIILFLVIIRIVYIKLSMSFYIY